MKDLFRRPGVQAVLGWLLATYLQLILKTVRWRHVDDACLEPFLTDRTGLLALMWHGRIPLSLATVPLDAALEDADGLALRRPARVGGEVRARRRAAPPPPVTGSPRSCAAAPGPAPARSRSPPAAPTPSRRRPRSSSPSRPRPSRRRAHWPRSCGSKAPTPSAPRRCRGSPARLGSDRSRRRCRARQGPDIARRVRPPRLPAARRRCRWERTPPPARRGGR